jgi:hypothetical protein
MFLYKKNLGGQASALKVGFSIEEGYAGEQSALAVS